MRAAIRLKVAADGQSNLKKVIHDGNDERATLILRKCREAMLGNGKVLIAQTIIRAGNKSDRINLMDAVMLAVMGGMERTEPEYGALFAASGLRLERVISTSQPIQILKGRLA